MSHSPPNYIDGVPVKIAERFKPPPEFKLPHSIQQRLAASLPSEKPPYQFDLELHVLSRVTEWKNMRLLEADKRHDRMRQRDQEQLVRLENEQKKKLNEVDYPNIQEDLSDPEDEKALKTVTGLATSQHNQFHVINNFNSILTPTIVPDLANNKNKFDVCVNKLDTFLPLTQNVINKNHNFNYSDFENDTSSPFDAMEMKTINDFDILAQVLQQSATIVHSNEANNNNTNTCNIDVKTEEGQNEEKSAIVENKVPENSSPSVAGGNFQQNVYYANNYGQSYAAPATENFLLNNYGPYNQLKQPHYLFPINTQQQQQQQQPPNFYTTNYNSHQPYYFNNHLAAAHQPTTTVESNYAPHFNYTSNQQAFVPNSLKVTPGHFEHSVNPEEMVPPTKASSKSKSVPDIIQELDNEIRNSEMRRARNNSQTVPSYHSEGEI
jgi:ubiquitin-associated protein 1